MAEYTWLAEHRARAAEQMLLQDRQAPRLKALQQAMAGPWQLLEDIVFEMIVGQSLQLATGYALDEWGAMVNEPRDGATDEDYRRFIRGRAAANSSRGDADRLILMMQLLTGGRVEYYEYSYGDIAIQSFGESLLSEENAKRIGRMMRDAKPAGYGLHLSHHVLGAFGFSERTRSPAVFGLNKGQLGQTF